MTERQFICALKKWLKDNNLKGVRKLRFHADSMYDFRKRKIYVGIEDKGEADGWFAEFLDSLGIEWEDIPTPVLCFLHELGHSQTIHSISKEILDECRVAKGVLRYYPDDEKNAAFVYWALEDELAANKWLVNFVNTNPNAVCALCQYFIDNWNNTVENINL